tara:strand:+ start:35 stop:931 length:897 start_codon:yes stop_codon:yes gene_type:complete
MNYSSIILPTDVKKQYLLCFIKHCLENWDRETFTSREIADETIGLVTSNCVTSTLNKISITPHATSNRPPNGNPVSVKIYYTKVVLKVLQKIALQSFTFEQYNRAYFGKSRTKTTSSTISSMDFNGGVNAENSSSTHLYNPLLLIFNEYTQEDIEVMHNDMQLGFNFKKYYQLTQALKEIVVIDDNNCITLPEGFKVDYEGYSIVDNNLLKFLSLPFTIDSLRTKRLHKIVAQTYNPFLDYDNLHVHHKCRNRSCINELHLTPAIINLHTTFHNRVGDHHPLNNPVETFQIVANTSLH